MKPIKVLFFAADPAAANPLQLGDDIREIRKRVREAKLETRIEFDSQFAARPDDVVSALLSTRPDVVHFSGHGNRHGLHFTSDDGYNKQLVTAAALKRVFEVFPHKIRLVVLSACESLELADSLTELVDCAIGNAGEILDRDAIRFNAAFYVALASGASVQSAFDQAIAQLELNDPGDSRPELLHRKKQTPEKLFLLPPYRRQKQGGLAATIVLVLLLILTSQPPPPPRIIPPGFAAVDCAAEAFRPRAGAFGGPDADGGNDGSSGPAADVANGKALCAAGDADSAFHLFESAAEAGNAEAMGLEAIAYLTGRGAHHDPPLAVEKLRKSGGKGDVRSMMALATAYESGYGADPFPYWSRYWLGKAARGGDAEAMRRLGVVYRDLRSDSALYWLSRAVAAGSADARVDLGLVYEDGVLVAADTARAVEEYTRAAKARSARGLFAVGAAYEQGVGVQRDAAEARRWFLRAVCAGSADAMNAIAEQYLGGIAVPADKRMATRWFRHAAAAGSAAALGKLRGLKAPERPREWTGPLGWAFARLGLSQTRPPVSCPATPAAR